MAIRNDAYREGAQSYNEGLRQYMVKVFAHMFIALFFTGVMSYSILSTGVIDYFISMSSGLTTAGWFITFSPLVFAIIMGSQLHKITADQAISLLWLYSALMGASLSITLYFYSGLSIARVFFITAVTFLSISIYGYTTRRNIMTWGSFLMMGIIGILITSLVNIFLQSSALYFALSIITVLLFVGFTAYDVQRLKYLFDSNDNIDKDEMAVVGALALYMDFINIFVALLHLIGERKAK